jgi:phosphopantetheinyl transferase
MATRGRVQEVLELSGVSFLSVAEGRKIFREALTQSLSSRAHQTRCLGVLGPLGPGFVLGHDGLLEELRAPLLASGRLELRYRFDLESSPYLADHRINQRFYLPAVSLFRQFLKRATRTGSLGVVEFQEVRLLSAVVFEDQEERDFLVRSRGDHYLVESRHDGQSTPVCELDFRLGGEDADSGKASVDLVARMRELEEREWMPFESRELLGSREEIYKTYFHGPRFQVLDRLTQVRGSLLEAEVHWDEKTNPLLEFGRIPWLLEAFFHTAGLATTIHIDCPYFYIPAAIGSCRVYPRLCQEAESARVSIEVLERGERKRFQGLIRNQAGEVLVEVRDLVMARSSELVPHRKAILPSGTPLSLAGCEVLQVEVEAVQSWLEECSEAPFTPAERAELEAHPEGLRRDQSMAGKIAAKILAREVLEREVHRRYRVSQFQVLSGGSPVQVSFLGAPHLDTLLMGWHFSISHSASRAVACVARVPCGVDIEELRPLAPESLERACTAAELRHYQKECASPGLDARLRALYQVALPLGSFCQREAVLKASGRGLSGYAGVDLAPLEFSTPQVARFEGELYRLLTVFDERYLLSVARLEEGGR